ncbi:hypothetical protein NQ317_003211 [Molorchus minor]|uniref:Uncharacterized protein n=1 Tax=Molorchus minor TaxID=1323400 RepID=A0ABQ9JPX7_9CUCU|nr:hypothetical protein NQ317_003211 [Molorchus minor]
MLFARNSHASSQWTMDDNGELNKEFIIEIMPPDKSSRVAKAVDTCAPRVKDVAGIEEKAYVLFKCWHEVDPQILVLF